MTPEEVGALRRKHYNAVVVKLDKPNPDLLRMRVRPDFPLPTHQPGQYTTLGMGYWEPRYPGCQDEDIRPGDEGKLVRRSYSISCPILDDDGSLLDRDRAGWLEFYVVLVRDSGNPIRPPALTLRLFLL